MHWRLSLFVTISSGEVTVDQFGKHNHKHNHNHNPHWLSSREESLAAVASQVTAASCQAQPGKAARMTDWLSINSFADEVHSLAIDKGWHSDSGNEDAFIERACNNLHDEVSELHEAWRNNRLHHLCDKADAMKKLGIQPLTCCEEELADILIRVLDNARRLDIDIASAAVRKHTFNCSRPHRHGGKRS